MSLPENTSIGFPTRLIRKLLIEGRTKIMEPSDHRNLRILC